jgi:hypothetical protein
VCFGISVLLSAAGKFDNFPAESILPICGSAFICGLFSVWLAQRLRKFRADSPYRWVWLSFVIPIAALLFFGVAVETGHLLSNGRAFKFDWEDWFTGIAVLFLVGLFPGAVAFILIAILKAAGKLLASMVSMFTLPGTEP